MLIIRGIHNIKGDFRNLCLSLGNFDGLHLGHKRIIQGMMERATKIRGIGALLTFNPHPRWVLKPDTPTLLLTTLHERVRILSEWHLNLLILVKFSRRLATMKPNEFVKQVLVEKLHIKEIFVAEGFLFGHERIGDINLLKTLGKEYGFVVNLIELAKDNGDIISSTLVRNKIKEGRIEEANRLLGYEYGVTGKVIKGSQRGWQMGYPTANMKIISKVLPPKGVYLVKVRIQGRTFFGIANIGNKPTFVRDGDIGIEVHILNLNEELYKKRVEIFFVSWLRHEVAFPSQQALIIQIKEDIEKANRWIQQQGNRLI